MSLIRCSECNGTVSSKAECCPHCGQPIKCKDRKGKRLLLNIIIICILASLFIGIWFYLDQKKNAEVFNTSYRNSLSIESDNQYSQNKSSFTNAPLTNNEKALEKALSYLNSQSFSYTGLVKQLEFSGFSHEEAVYGADQCDADWMEQALIQAKHYLASQAFSYTGLKNQLEFSGFTTEQAKYGVDHCNADWNEQAVLKARSYKRTFPDWDSSKLVNQLIHSGFTESEAQYGAEHI